MINFDSIEACIQEGTLTFLIGPQPKDRTEWLQKINDSIESAKQPTMLSTDRKGLFKRLFYRLDGDDNSELLPIKKTTHLSFLNQLEKNDIQVLEDGIDDPSLTVQNYLSSSLGISFLVEKKIELDYWLSWSGLKSRQKSLISDLTCEKQIILKLASKLIKGPRLILIDSILDSLNTAPRNDILTLLKKTAKKHKFAFVLSTNSLASAYSHATTIAVIIDNNIHQIADPQTIYYAPSTTDIALFTGEGSLYPVTVLNNNVIKIENEIHEATLPANLIGEKKLNLFIRANQIFFNPTSDIEITIMDIKFMGSISIYTVKTSTGHHLTLADYTANEYKVGEKVGINFQFTSFPLFKIKETVPTQYAQISV